MTDHQVTEAMLRLGGSFVRHLAMTFRAADIVNQHRLKEAFAGEWAEYTRLALLLEQGQHDDQEA